MTNKKKENLHTGKDHKTNETWLLRLLVKTEKKIIKEEKELTFSTQINFLSFCYTTKKNLKPHYEEFRITTKKM